jgi:D-sedoheptulose 7-phosphate isomerase
MEPQYMEKLNNVILDILEESIKTKEHFVKNNVDLIVTAAEMIARCISSGHKILIFGNGGSAADAQHIAAEFVNRFIIERPPIAALALTTDTSIITSIGNDYSYDDIFSKQILALGKPDDIAIGISTSGTSKNVVNAMKTAKDMGLFTISMTGAKGALAEYSDIIFSVSLGITPRIQETHSILGHMLCDLVDRILYTDKYTSDNE